MTVQLTESSGEYPTESSSEYWKCRYKYDVQDPPIRSFIISEMRSELKVSLNNFTYDLLDKVPIKFHYDHFTSTTYEMLLDVTTFSDLGGYWYLDDCQGTVWTIKIPKEIMALVKAEGSPYKRTKCGYWTVDYDNFELLANPFWIGYTEDQAEHESYESEMEESRYDFDNWDIYKIIRAKVRKWLDS